MPMLKDTIFALQEPDLKELLTVVGFPTTGRLQTLRARVYHAVQTHRAAILRKLIQMGRLADEPTPVRATRASRSVKCWGTRASQSPGTQISDIRSLPTEPTPTTKEIECIPPPPIPRRPDVVLKPHPFSDVLATLIPVTSLQSADQSEVFWLMAQHVQLIRNGYNAITKKFDYQIQLRLGLLESSPQNDRYPMNLCIFVNGTQIELRYADSPIDITSVVLPTSLVPNTIKIRHTPTAFPFVFTINFVKEVSTKMILSRFPMKVPFFTVVLINETLKERSVESMDSHIFLSLICPLSQKHFKLPCRALTCTHPSAFDAEAFIMLNRERALWKCPVCQKTSTPDLLYIDRYFCDVLETLKKSRAIDLCSEIRVKANGDWTPIIEEGTNKFWTVEEAPPPQYMIT